MNHHTGFHLVLSKAKGGISIIAQFSFPLKSNEFFGTAGLHMLLLNSPLPN